jgi:hypothetical protein
MFINLLGSIQKVLEGKGWQGRSPKAEVEFTNFLASRVYLGFLKA